MVAISGKGAMASLRLGGRADRDVVIMFALSTARVLSESCWVPCLFCSFELIACRWRGSTDEGFEAFFLVWRRFISA